MKKIYVTLVFALSFTAVFCQEFTAKVFDKQTQQPVPHAQVYLVDLNTGTVADEKGVFKIQIPNYKNLHIQVRAMGYKILNTIVNAESNSIFYLEPGHLNIDEIIISAPLSRLGRENIVNISHKKLGDLQEDSSLNLSETLANMAGVSQITTGGIGKPIIRGLGGSRVVTYAQGIRIENQQWGDEHGLGVSAAGIEAVELIKGPASLAYGADALGGVLYFVDEKYANPNNIQTFFKSKFFSNTLGLKNQVGFKINKNKFKWNFFGAYDSHADYKIPNGKRVFNTRFNQKNIKILGGFQKKYWISEVKYSFLENNFGIPHEAAFKESTARNFISPYQNINHHNVTFKNALFLADSKLDIVLGYSYNKRKEIEEAHAHDEDKHEGENGLDLRLHTFSSNIKWHSPVYKGFLKFTVGTQSMFKNNKNYGHEILIPNAQTTDLGGFAVATMDFSELKFQTGIRADYRKIDAKKTSSEEGKTFPALQKWYRGFTYSAATSYKFDAVKFQLNISTGFRVPNTSELLSDGVHHGTNRYYVGDNTLENEYATQIDFMLDYENDHLKLYANPFYNQIKNYIYLFADGTKKEKLPVFQYGQIDAVLYGGETGIHYHPHSLHGLHLESNFSAVIAEDSNKKALPLIPQMRLNSKIAFAGMGPKKFMRIKNIFLQHIYNFAQNRVSTFETTSPAYQLLHMGIDFEFFTKYTPIEIQMGIKNILNTPYIDHLSRFKNLDIQNQGINYHIGIKIPLEIRNF